ncbi:MAG: alpha/beta fold hydrolase [Parachlamydiaceae bacterium]
MSKIEKRESVVLVNQGQDIFGIFHRPTMPSPYPTVLICHGLAGDKCGKNRAYVNISEQFSRYGIASFRFDFRGSGDSEGDFSEATLESEVSDVSVALEYLRQRPDVDGNRIGIFGRSIGGAVSIIAAAQDTHIKSMVIWAPVYDGSQWQSLWHQLHTQEISDEARQEAMRVNGQVPGVNFFKQLFSLHMDDHLKQLDHVPLLHIHGELDTIVLPYHADRYREGRSLAKAESKFILLPKSDHDFIESKELKIAMDETLNWFKKTL